MQATTAGEPGVSSRSRLRALLACTRPTQWVKNLLVAAVPFAAGALGRWSVLEQTLIAMALFTLASAGTYLLNDARDVDRDRLHPQKRHRPVAAGHVSPRLAAVVGALLIATAVGVGFVVTVPLGLVCLAYVLATTAYSLGLKQVPWLEICLVVSGFLLRALAGAAATRVPVSGWFLLVTVSGALFLVIGKRHSEKRLLAAGAPRHRQVLRAYDDRVLRRLVVGSAVVLCAAYAGWAYGSGLGLHREIAFASLVPVAASLVRYAILIARGVAGAPEEILMRDRFVQCAALGWIALFGLELMGA